MTVGPEPSLWDPLTREGGRSDLLLSWTGDAYTAWSWEDWCARSLRFARALRELGVRAGDRVACLLTNSPDVCAGVLGVWLSGATLLSLPLISRGMDAAGYVAQLRRIVRQSEPVVLLCDQSFTRLLEDAELGVRVAAFQDTDHARESEPVLLDAEMRRRSSNTRREALPSRAAAS